MHITFFIYISEREKRDIDRVGAYREKHEFYKRESNLEISFENPSTRRLHWFV